MFNIYEQKWMFILDGGGDGEYDIDTAKSRLYVYKILKI